MVSSQGKKNKEKELAEESLKTQKARMKLQNRFEIMDAQMTRDAMEKKIPEIHRWISRHADRRISLKDKSISLFDENQNAAAMSLKIAKIAEHLSE